MNHTQALQALALKIRIGAVEQFKARGFGHVGGEVPCFGETFASPQDGLHEA